MGKKSTRQVVPEATPPPEPVDRKKLDQVTLAVGRKPSGVTSKGGPQKTLLKEREAWKKRESLLMGDPAGD